MRSVIASLILNFFFQFSGMAETPDTLTYNFSRQPNGDADYAQLEKEGQKWKLGNEKKIANRTVARKIIAPSGTFTFGYNSKTKTDSLISESGELVALISYNASSLFSVSIPGGPAFRLAKETDKKWKYYTDKDLVLDCVITKNKGANNYTFEFISIGEGVNQNDLDTLILMAQVYGVNRIVTIKKRPVFFAMMASGLALGIVARSMAANNDPLP